MMTYRKFLAALAEANRRCDAYAKARAARYRSKDPWKRDEADAVVNRADSDLDQEIDWGAL